MDNKGERIEWSFADYGSGSFHIVSAKRAPEQAASIVEQPVRPVRHGAGHAQPGLLCRLAAVLRVERCSA